MDYKLCQYSVSLDKYLPQSYCNPIMKTVHLFTICVLAIMCSHVESQGSFPSRDDQPRAPALPSGLALQQFQQGSRGQQSGGSATAFQRRFPPSRSFRFLVADDRCRVWRRATEHNCPLAFNRFPFQRMCNDDELAEHSADLVYPIWIYDRFTGRRTNCINGHPAVACPLVNYSCSSFPFRARRDLNDDEEAFESDIGPGDEEAPEFENDEEALEEEWD